MRITIQNQGQFQKIQKKGVKEIVAERKSTLGQLREKFPSNGGWSIFIENKKGGNTPSVPPLPNLPLKNAPQEGNS